ncbi:MULTISPECIES: TetR/AcrR family transcriptional regulator [Alphaproteobacteria]|uniref:TetR family transcriptional regulator n=2 Tax=Alphaproteobacteria TaxID=28211 RepID=A0A512HIS6_9HYPH|nr:MULTISPECIES: TetR/AcrR family transcriptional regulator [Alphaproteobacteria]GEO85356.1 TetR family transcriptional regulator [Ciceribacter naphthalenivorans]GLR20995.1 TetR family transcriptional regulator [Ciceribacter naphthalenivorans]GLT03851.1 TetR family transcriptional regulator [Sphingomonas psychrolutea]
MGKPTTTRRTSIGSQRNPASEEAILQAAQAILLEGGLQAFSIEAVAKRAKAGKPTIYRWWPSKAALLLDVYHRQKDGVPHPDTGDVREDLVQFLAGLMGFWRDGGGAIFRSIIAEAQSDAGALEALQSYVLSRCLQTGEILRRGQARGTVRNDIDPDLVIELFSSFAWSRLLTSRLEVTRQQVEQIVSAVVDGVAAESQHQ